METAPERPKNFDPLQHCLDCLTVEEEKASVKSSNSKEVASVTSSKSASKSTVVSPAPVAVVAAAPLVVVEEDISVNSTKRERFSSLNGTGAVSGAVDASEEEQPSSLELLETMRTVLEAEMKQSDEKDLQIMELETTLAELEATNQELTEEVAFKAQECEHARDHLATKGKQFDYLRVAVLAAAKAVVTGPPTTSTTN